MQGIAVFLGLCVLKLGLLQVGVVKDNYDFEIEYQDFQNFSYTMYPKMDVFFTDMNIPVILDPEESAIALDGDEFYLVPGSRTTIHKEADGIWYFERIDKEQVTPAPKE